MYTGYEFGTSTTTGYVGYAGYTQPDGTSKLCLSCHDGSVALGAYGGQAGSTTMAGYNGGLASLSTDLTNDHPISIPYDSAVGGGLHIKTYIYNNYAAGGTTGNWATYTTSGKTTGSKLDANGEVQCTSCHGPHSNSKGYQLGMDNRGSALCLACHKK
jgi:predicted CXXCH cytochrome family protein